MVKKIYSQAFPRRPPGIAILAPTGVDTVPKESLAQRRWVSIGREVRPVGWLWQNECSLIA